MLARVLAGSVVAVINKEVHNARSSESKRSGACPPSSSSFANAALSLSCMNLCISGESMAESVVYTVGMGAGSGGPYPIAASSLAHTGSLLFCDVSHPQNTHKAIFRRI